MSSVSMSQVSVSIGTSSDRVRVPALSIVLVAKRLSVQQAGRDCKVLCCVDSRLGWHYHAGRHS